MEKSIKIMTTGKVDIGSSQKVGAFHQIAIKLSMQRILPFELFAHGVPFEASKTYNTLKNEFESRRAIAIFEVQRQALRGF